MNNSNLGVYDLSGHMALVVDVAGIMKEYAHTPADLRKYVWTGGQPIRKAGETKGRISPQPADFGKMLKAAREDEFIHGCLDVASEFALSELGCKNTNVQRWLETATAPRNKSLVQLLKGMIYNYKACGNGLLIKLRNPRGEWVGLERLLPNETQIIEVYNANGFLAPDYVQYKNFKRVWYPYADIIHLYNDIEISDTWGMQGWPAVLAAETLKEIKVFNHNYFKHGGLIEYIIFVEGGQIQGQTAETNPETGEPRKVDVYQRLTEVLRAAATNKNSHALAMLETTAGSKVQVQPLRSTYEGGFLELQKALQSQIIAYYRTPQRLLGQLISGSLGGDNASDITIYHETVVRPMQLTLASLLTAEFNAEFPTWGVKTTDWNFGDLTRLFKSPTQLAWDTQTNQNPVD